MIVFNHMFGFAAPPRCASTWMQKAIGEVFPDAKGDKHTFENRPDLMTVTMVRHPYTWLHSIYYKLKGGMCGIDAADRFAVEVRNRSFEQFIEHYLKTEDLLVGDMFDEYRCSSIYRVEDLPWCWIEFAEMAGASREQTEVFRERPAVNALTDRDGRFDKNVDKIKRSLELRHEVFQKEKKWCIEHDYFA